MFFFFSVLDKRALCVCGSRQSVVSFPCRGNSDQRRLQSSVWCMLLDNLWSNFLVAIKLFCLVMTMLLCYCWGGNIRNRWQKVWRISPPPPSLLIFRTYSVKPLWLLLLSSFFVLNTENCFSHLSTEYPWNCNLCCLERWLFGAEWCGWQFKYLGIKGKSNQVKT